MRRMIGTTMAAMSFAVALNAQEPRRASSPPPSAPAPRARVGYAAPEPPPAAAAPAQIGQPTFFYSPEGYIVNGAPFLVLSDGSVLANFGNGYERVLRPCAAARGSSHAPQEATGRDALGRILPPPGIAALQAGTRGQIQGAAPARNVQACYRTDGRGRTHVTTGY